MIIINLPLKDRTLFHEIGHFKQDIEYGYTTENTSPIILEYHNIIMHENLFDDHPRTGYTQKSGDIWDNTWMKKDTNDKKTQFLRSKKTVLENKDKNVRKKLETSQKAKDAEVYKLLMQKFDQMYEESIGDIEKEYFVKKWKYNMLTEVYSKL